MLKSTPYVAMSQFYFYQITKRNNERKLNVIHKYYGMY